MKAKGWSVMLRLKKGPHAVAFIKWLKGEFIKWLKGEKTGAFI